MLRTAMSRSGRSNDSSKVWSSREGKIFPLIIYWNALETALPWFRLLFRLVIRLRVSRKCWPTNTELPQTLNRAWIVFPSWVLSRLYKVALSYTTKVGRSKLFYSILILFLVPPNGLVIYCGTIVTDEGKEKKVNIDFEPFKAVNTSLYLCDNKFHTEALQCKYR